MPGIYLHIPFCKQACHYCNFHFSTSLRHKPTMLEAMLQEIRLRRDYLQGATLDSIYFGGGTPSLLSTAELMRFFDTIFHYFAVAPDAEITLEANPDDLTVDKIAALRQTPVNRLSIGIQSFAEVDLQWMNRAHRADEAQICIENALAAGFDNLTVDLIYGAPTMPDAQWIANIQKVLDYGIPHVSCYALTVEPETALAHFVKTGKTRPVDEEQAARQFEILVQMLQTHGYEHYEISNFALPGRYARHNSSYWSGEAYLGIGPSAHSFDGGLVRRWNVAHNAHYWQYMATTPEALSQLQGTLFEQEVLSPAQRYNEYVMTALRTMWGVQADHLWRMHEAFAAHFEQKVQPFIRAGQVQHFDQTYTLTAAGKLLADFIAAELFFEN
ncbi:MAG TPA: radical SAM family heme chaperone HemW [Saprospiraceae bacterium]|nr:radical SAM family heme chaperone HemW [Saprospiraceae bacterium]HMP23792.1 radical SAM family heme chaperone HemW [Saprospiraceae bacterium]